MSIAFGWQPMSFLGVYDTVFPVSVVVTITNVGDSNFPGGNLTGVVTQSSGGYIYPLQSHVSVILPNQAQAIVFTLPAIHLQGNSLFTVTILGVDTSQLGRITPSEMGSTGTITQNFQGPEVFIFYAIGVALVLAFVVTSVQNYARRKVGKQKDTIDNRIESAAKSLSRTAQTVTRIQNDLRALQPAILKLRQEGIAARRTKLTKVEREALQYVFRGELKKERRIYLAIAFAVSAIFFLLALLWPLLFR